MQNTSVTAMTVVGVTLPTNVTAAARLCSRTAICRFDRRQGELPNKFKCIDEFQRRAPEAVRVGPWKS